MTRPLEVADTVSLGEAAAIGRIEKALFGGDERLVRVGRYEVIEMIGAGAFGKVYRARDPQLDRTIALKVLAVEDARGDDLLGEAKVMATIGHPNVAAVHDAGVLADVTPHRVFIAMELVDGGNLRGWLAAPRDRARILDVMRQAGRGLAAAHAAGIVHRDFKPENLLVGADGRVRVVDFGLARTAPTSIAPETDVTQTATGTIAGTPAYMAPELFEGAAANAATDQFAYCVTLWEALCGARPFAASSIEELRAAFERPLVVPRRLGLSRRVVRALARGLAPTPAARHPSMEALVHELEPRRSARWLVAAAVAIAGLAVALTVVASRGDRAAPAPCPRALGELAGVWDDTRKAAIGAAFQATGVAHAGASFDRLAGLLDRATGEWLDAHDAACVATHIHHVQSPELLDRRIACLREWRRQLSALTATYARATPTLVDQATRATGELPPLARCANTAELAAGPARPSDPAVAAKIDELNDRLAEARVQYFVGETAEALAIAEQVASDADAIHDDSVQVSSTLWQGQALTALGRYPEAREVARRCFDLALGIRDHRSAALAASVIAFTGAYDSSIAAESLQWVRTGESLRQKLGNDDEVAASLAHVEGNIYLTAADPARAKPALERAVAAWRRLAPEHPNAVTSLAMLGVSELNLGAVEAARGHLVESTRLTERDLGPAHAELAGSINLALVEAASGRYADAAKSTDRGLAIQIAALGAEHPLVGYGHLNRGQIAAAMGDRATADREFAEAARIAAASYGPGHAVTVVIDLAAGEHAARTGRGDVAREHARRAIAAVDPDDHGPRALGEATLALAERARGDRAAALAMARSALVQIAAAPKATPSQRAIVHDIAGEILLDSGHAADAAAALRSGDEELGHGPPDPFRRARIRFALARAANDRAAAAALLRELPAELDPAFRAAVARFAGR